MAVRPKTAKKNPPTKRGKPSRRSHARTELGYLLLSVKKKKSDEDKTAEEIEKLIEHWRGVVDGDSECPGEPPPPPFEYDPQGNPSQNLGSGESGRLTKKMGGHL